jgi:hypothetical protein
LVNARIVLLHERNDETRTPMRFRADVVVHAADGQLLALVEIKNVEKFDRNIAAGIRQNLAEYWSLPDVPFLLLVSQDLGYLWSNEQGEHPDLAPLIEFSMRPVMERYFPNGMDHRRIPGAELEYVVFQWLNDLVWSRAAADDESSLPLHNSVFANAIRGGRVLMEALV